MTEPDDKLPVLRVLCEALRREAQPHLVSIAVVSRAAVSRATHISVAAPASAPESLLLRRASCSLPAAAQACPRSAPQIGAQMGGRLAWRAARRAAWQRVRQGAEEAVRPLRPRLRTRTSAQMIPAPDKNQRASSYCERAAARRTGAREVWGGISRNSHDQFGGRPPFSSAGRSYTPGGSSLSGP